MKCGRQVFRQTLKHRSSRAAHELDGGIRRNLLYAVLRSYRANVAKVTEAGQARLITRAGRPGRFGNGPVRLSQRCCVDWFTGVEKHHNGSRPRLARNPVFLGSLACLERGQNMDSIHRVVAQLVAQRSPKPQVAGSSPVCPAQAVPGFPRSKRSNHDSDQSRVNDVCIDE